MKPILEVKHISKKFHLHHGQGPYLSLRDTISSLFGNGTFRGQWQRTKSQSPDFYALSDISFDVYPGEAVGIIGNNGAGKSTLLKIISKITPPTDGKIIMRGRASSLLEVGTGFHSELTGRENVFLNGSILGMKRTEIHAKFDEIVDFSGVAKFIDTPIKHYSSGMQLRLAFAVAAFLEPEILLIDEVLAVGDAEFQNKCLKKMEEVTKSGRTVLFVSHSLGTINAFCNKCVLIENGTIKRIGATSEVVQEYARSANEKNISPDKKIEDFMRNKGDKRVFFLECSISNLNGVRKNSFLIGEEIEIDITIQSSYDGKIAFWLIFFDRDFKPILCSHQKDTGFIVISGGKSVVSYKTNSIGLLPGEYVISAGVFDQDLNFLEWIDNCQDVTILPTFLNGQPFDNRWGIVNQKATWSLSGYGF